LRMRRRGIAARLCRFGVGRAFAPGYTLMVTTRAVPRPFRLESIQHLVPPSQNRRVELAQRHGGVLRYFPTEQPVNPRVLPGELRSHKATAQLPGKRLELSREVGLASVKGPEPGL